MLGKVDSLYITEHFLPFTFTFDEDAAIPAEFFEEHV